MPTPAIITMTSTKRKHPKADRTKKSWVQIVEQICTRPTALWEIYAQVKRHPKARGKENVEAKVRQVLYIHPDRFFEFSPGKWALVDFYSPDEVNQCRLSRKKRLGQRRNPGR